MNDNFFKGWFVFIAIVQLAALGIGIWAVIHLVNWITSI